MFASFCILACFSLFFPRPGFSGESKNHMSTPRPPVMKAGIALVVGNQSYARWPLKSAANDARAIADALETVGFSVDLAVDLDWEEMNRTIDSFGEKLASRGGVGLFYYAGHGLQVDSVNYLFPVDSDIEHLRQIKYKAINASQVISEMENARNGTNIMILDASYGNPLKSEFRSLEKGLACMDAPIGSIIAYSATPGQEAVGVSGDNSLYTAELTRNMKIPGVRLVDMFNNVRKAVRTETNGLQVPMESTSLEGPFYFVRTGLEKHALALLDDKNKDAWIESNTGIEFARVPAGCYDMGCGSWSSDCGEDEEPVHEVCLDEYWMSKYEITNEQFIIFLNELNQWGPKGENWFKTKTGALDSRIIGDIGGFSVEPGFEKHPVVEVSWYGANAFVKWLSEKCGQNIGLPTEAQWEYACRSGGKHEMYSGSNDPDSVSWHSADGILQPVGLKAPNGLGLFDMSGNVWEWCRDKYGKYSYAGHSRENPVVLLIEGIPGERSARVIRGGSYRYDPRRGRSTNRGNLWLAGKSGDVGFRVVMEKPARGLSRQTFLAQSGQSKKCPIQ